MLPLLVLVLLGRVGRVAAFAPVPVILSRDSAQLGAKWGSTPVVSWTRRGPGHCRGPGTFVAAVPSATLGRIVARAEPCNRRSSTSRVMGRISLLLPSVLSAFRTLRHHALKVSFVCVLAVSAFFTNATPAHASPSPTLSTYDPTAPALEVPGAERYLKKFMWSPDKYNLFESIYLEAEQPFSETLAPGSKIPVSSAMLAKVVTEVGPTLAVGGLVLGGGVGAVKLDGYIKSLKEREREEEIELYGEELTVDATPVEMPDIELPPDEDDEDSAA